MKKPLFKNLNCKEDLRSSVFFFEGPNGHQVRTGAKVVVSTPIEGLRYGYFQRGSFKQVRSSQGRKSLNNMGAWLQLARCWKLELGTLVSKYETVENFFRVLQEEPTTVVQLDEDLKEALGRSLKTTRETAVRFVLLIKGPHEPALFEELERSLAQLRHRLLYQGGQIFRTEGPVETHAAALGLLKQLAGCRVL